MSTAREQAAAEPQQLSGQQMRALGKQYAEALKTIKDDLALRKLALDQACNVVTATNSTAGSQLKFHDPITLAEAMYEFLTKGENNH